MHVDSSCCSLMLIVKDVWGQLSQYSKEIMTMFLFSYQLVVIFTMFKSGNIDNNVSNIEDQYMFYDAFSTRLFCWVFLERSCSLHWEVTDSYSGSFCYEGIQPMLSSLSPLCVLLLWDPSVLLY